MNQVTTPPPSLIRRRTIYPLSVGRYIVERRVYLVKGPFVGWIRVGSFTWHLWPADLPGFDQALLWETRELLHCDGLLFLAKGWNVREVIK